MIRPIASLCMCCLALSTQAETLLVRAGKLIDVERCRVVADQLVRIQNERIVAIGDYKPSASPDATPIDWFAYTVVPGLLDMHTRLVGDISSAVIAAPLQRSQRSVEGVIKSGRNVELH